MHIIEYYNITLHTMSDAVERKHGLVVKPHTRDLTAKMTSVSGGSVTFSLGSSGTWVWVAGTTTGLLLRTILCKSLVLMPRVKFVEKMRKTRMPKSLYRVRILK